MKRPLLRLKFNCLPVKIHQVNYSEGIINSRVLSDDSLFFAVFMKICPMLSFLTLQRSREGLLSIYSKSTTLLRHLN